MTNTDQIEELLERIEALKVEVRDLRFAKLVAERRALKAEDALSARPTPPPTRVVAARKTFVRHCKKCGRMIDTRLEGQSGKTVVVCLNGHFIKALAVRPAAPSGEPTVTKCPPRYASGATRRS